MSIVIRFAPSPTGHLHLGHAASALLAWRSARAVGGRFLLRIEDIDPGRCRPEFDAAIREDLARTLMDEPDGFVSMDAIRRAEFAWGQEDERKQDKRQHRDWRKRTANADLHRMAMLWTIIDKGMKDGSDTLGYGDGWSRYCLSGHCIDCAAHS